MSDPGSTEENGSAALSAEVVTSIAGIGVCFAALFALLSAGETLSASLTYQSHTSMLVFLIFAVLFGLKRVRLLKSAITVIGLAVAVATLAMLLAAVVPGTVMRVISLVGVFAVAGTLVWPPSQMVRGRGQSLKVSGHSAALTEFDSNVSGTLKALHSASVIRDGDIREHGQAVANLAERLGEHLGLPPVEVKALYWAALLHDVGKVGVERSVLRKPGKLTRDEFSTVMHHASIGADLIRSVGSGLLYQMIALMVLHHHERWDGRGYPSGRASTDIPVGARIIAITDVFEALISERAYRPAMREAEALKVIITGSGTHFDPDIVSLFLKMLSEQVREEFTVDARAAASQPADDEVADPRRSSLSCARTTLAGLS